MICQIGIVRGVFFLSFFSGLSLFCIKPQKGLLRLRSSEKCLMLRLRNSTDRFHGQEVFFPSSLKILKQKENFFFGDIVVFGKGEEDEHNKRTFIMCYPC